MFHFIEREFRLAPLPLLLMIMATAIILRSFYMIMDRPQQSYANEHDVAHEIAHEATVPEAQPQPRQPRLAPTQAHRLAQSQPQARTQTYRQSQSQKVYTQPRVWPQNYHARQPTRITRAPASNGRGPASIGPASATGLRFQPQSHFQPGIQKKSTSFLAKVIGKDAVRDLKEIINSEERTEYFLQRELNVADSDLKLIKDEKVRLYTKLRELDQKGEPAKTQQERTTLLQQHKAWMESVLGAEGYQRLQQIRGL